MSNTLNLARAWRSKTFDEIVGQDLAVRMVKNSLFKNQLFPVYLIAGQRGCGKTTLARVFAAAINCEKRSAFSQNPREVLLPCLACQSCEAMKSGSHPDFYEIDAASHTGVDNVRSLIEGASLLPGLGQKKIYLIDEAHMLSKAAFNAFLKILEEPPLSVVFMLATTDPHKILDTVRSRCFQIFLNPLEQVALSTYLARICDAEGLAYDNQALTLIAHESEGSVRDALNIIERLRLAFGSISYEQVIKTLGDVGYHQVIMLCNATFNGGAAEVVKMLDELQLKRFSPVQLWKKVIEVLKALAWAKHGQAYDLLALYADDIKIVADKISLNQIVDALQLWYDAEPLYAKTHSPHILIEMLFMQMNTHCSSSVSGGPDPIKKNSVYKKPVEEIKKPIVPEEKREPQVSQQAGPWQKFINALQHKEDPLVLSVFKQANFLGIHEGQVHVVFASHHQFFKELIDQTTGTWLPLLHAEFGQTSMLKAEFNGEFNAQVLYQAREPAQPIPVSRPQLIKPAQAVKEASSGASYAQKISMNDPERFKKMRALLALFPGSVTEEKGFSYE